MSISLSSFSQTRIPKIKQGFFFLLWRVERMSTRAGTLCRDPNEIIIVTRSNRTIASHRFVGLSSSSFFFFFFFFFFVDSVTRSARVSCHWATRFISFHIGGSRALRVKNESPGFRSKAPLLRNQCKRSRGRIFSAPDIPRDVSTDTEDRQI